MFLYIIPFLLLLVVAVVLKQREGKNSADENESTKTKTKSKTNPEQPKGTKTRISNQKGKRSKADVAVDAPPAVQTTVVAPELLQKLQQLIHGGHFSTAEAHINQALNRDPKQHELYLILLKVHLLQKDDLAINQLINHIRSLSAPELLAEAEAKRLEHEQMQSIEAEYLNEIHETEVKPQKPSPFDGLQFQREQVSSAVPLVTESVAEPNTASSPLQFNDFNLSHHLTDNSATETQASTEPVTNHEPLHVDFNFASPSPVTTSHTANSDSTFSLNLEKPSEPLNSSLPDISLAETPLQTVSVAPEFQFNLDMANDNTAPSTPDLNLNVPDNNLSITPVQADQDLSTALEFDPSSFKLAAHNQTTPNTETPSSTDNSMDFDLSSFSFALETDSAPAVNAPHALDANDFVEQTSAQIVVKDDASALSFDLNAPSSSNNQADALLDLNFAAETSSTATTTTHSFVLDTHSTGHPTDHQPDRQHDSGLSNTGHDVLLQQFPELRKLNATQLDIDLAALYADYAAPEAAETLLDDVASKSLSPDQKQQLQQLQQRISASKA